MCENANKITQMDFSYLTLVENMLTIYFDTNVVGKIKRKNETLLFAVMRSQLKTAIRILQEILEKEDIERYQYIKITANECITDISNLLEQVKYA
jgi:hypothetical protein